MEDEKTEDGEVILVPEGGQYMTRAVVLTDMVKRGYKEEKEGWIKSQYLPTGWFYKNVGSRI